MINRPENYLLVIFNSGIVKKFADRLFEKINSGGHQQNTARNLVQSDI